MARSLEDMIRGVVRESSLQIAGKLLNMTELSVKQIAEVTELSEDDVQQIADSQTTVLGMAKAKQRD